MYTIKIVPDKMILHGSRVLSGDPEIILSHSFDCAPVSTFCPRALAVAAIFLVFVRQFASLSFGCVLIIASFVVLSCCAKFSFLESAASVRCAEIKQ
jgi:hypothetical protein